MRTYEAVLILRTEEDLLDKGRKFIKDLFKKSQCEILKEEDMGNRELAYEINKNSRGYYLYYELNTDTQNIQTFAKALKLRNEILKYLFLRKGE